MYGTTMRSFNVNKASKSKEKKEKSFFSVNSRTRSRKDAKKLDDTKYMKLEDETDTTNIDVPSEKERANDGFSLKDLPIASVIITVILTMMTLIMTSGFGGM